MSTVNFDLFKRLLTRCDEIAAEAGMKSTVAQVYGDILKPPASGYLLAHAEAKAAESDYTAKLALSTAALEDLDPLFREARSVVAAYVPTLTLPATLKSQPTETDQRNAIRDLNAEITKHQPRPWAAQLLGGEYGTQAAATITALEATVAADTARAEARVRRAEAFEAAHEPFYRWKWVVREALGARSKQYKRIHVRSRAGSTGESEDEGKETKGKDTKATETKATDSTAKDSAAKGGAGNDTPVVTPAPEGPSQPSAPAPHPR